MVTMMRLMALVLVAFLFAGCASAPPNGDTSCCEAPAPGTARVHMGGEVSGGMSFWR